MTTSPSPHHPDGLSDSPRPIVVLSVAAVFSVLLLLALTAVGARPAGASEFNPNPAASMSSACVAAEFGTDIAVTMTNAGGLADAHFTVDSFAYGPTSHVVAPNQTEVFVIDGVPDGTHVEVTVTGDNGVVASQSFDTDCYGYTGHLISVCDGVQAHLELHLVRTGAIAGNVYIDVDGQTVASEWVDDTWDHSLPVPTDVPLDVVVADNHDGLMFHYTEPVHCEAPVPSTTVPSTTVPSTTVPSTTVATTTPPAVLGTVVDEPTDPIQPGTTPRELAFTGRTTVPFTLVGAALLAAGLAVLGAVGHLRRRVGPTT